MKKVKQSNQNHNSGTPMLSTHSPAPQMSTHLQTQSSMQQLYNSTKRTTHNKSVNNNPQPDRPTPSVMLSMPAKERLSTGVLESGNLSLKPSSYQRDSRGPEGLGNSKTQVLRHNKKSESTEGTPGSTIPSKINTSLKNKHAFEKYHPGSKDENFQPPSKPSSNGGGNQSKLGQYKQTTANHKRLQGSGNKRVDAGLLNYQSA